MAWGSKGWVGGRIHIGRNGKRTYFIRRMLNGRRFDVSTKCHTERGAMEALIRFEKDPENFTAGDVKPDRLVLDQALIDQFIEWSEHAKQNSDGWVRKQRRLLEWWKDVLPSSRDLRKLDVARDIIAALDSAPAERSHKVAVLKALFGWMRKVTHRIAAGEDPTLGVLSAPPSKVAQATRSKVISLEDEAKLIAKLPEKYADAARLLAATGMHVTELERFAAGGQVEGTTITLPHTKGGAPHRIEVTSDVADVARRILGRGSLGESAVTKAVAAAAKSLGLRFGAGMWRHCFATRLVEAGATPEAISVYLHHRSKATTIKFYSTLAVVPMPVVRPPLRLVKS